MSFNKIIIVGNLGRDPEVKFTPQGQQVCEFSVATSEKRKNSNGEQTEETTWFRVTFWGRQAEIAAQYLAKGRQAYIEGRLRAREWTDKEGKTRTSLEVFGSELRLLGSRSDSNSNSKVSSDADIDFDVKPSPKPATSPKSSSSYPQNSDDAVTEDDIPF